MLNKLHGIKLQATGMRVKLMQCSFMVMHGLCEQSESASIASLLVSMQPLYATALSLSACVACCAVSRFRVSRVREIIAAVLKQRLTGAVYHADNTSSWAREIADDIKRRLKGVEDGQRVSMAT